jgi:hypothetical protein
MSTTQPIERAPASIPADNRPLSPAPAPTEWRIPITGRRILGAVRYLAAQYPTSRQLRRSLIGGAAAGIVIGLILVPVTARADSAPIPAGWADAQAHANGAPLANYPQPASEQVNSLTIPPSPSTGQSPNGTYDGAPLADYSQTWATEHGGASQTLMSCPGLAAAKPWD